jgi:hypothetical protein
MNPFHAGAVAMVVSDSSTDVGARSRITAANQRKTSGIKFATRHLIDCQFQVDLMLQVH